MNLKFDQAAWNVVPAIHLWQPCFPRRHHFMHAIGGMSWGRMAAAWGQKYLGFSNH